MSPNIISMTLYAIAVPLILYTKPHTKNTLDIWSMKVVFDIGKNINSSLRERNFEFLKKRSTITAKNKTTE